MADDDLAHPTTPEKPHPPRTTRWLLAASLGMATGAVALNAYAVWVRMPTGGRSPDTVGSATELLVTSLVLAVLALAAMTWIAFSAQLGSAETRHVGLLLVATVLVTVFAYVNSAPRSAAVRLSGPGAHPAVSLAQAAWPLLVVASLLLLAGVMRAGAAGSWRRAALALFTPFTIVGLVVSLGAGVAVAQLWQRGQVHPVTAQPIAIPPYPTAAVGSTVTYSVRVADADEVMPAGAGFVTVDGRDVVAYDGATGAQRWRLPAGAFPNTCVLRDVRSTGTAPDSVVIAECVRPTLRRAPEHPADANGNEPVLFGLDAITGRILWLNDQNLALAYTTAPPTSVVPVTRNGEVGVIDPHTGLLQWTRPGASKPCSESAEVVRDDIVILPCYGRTTTRVIDGVTGAERSFDIRLPAELDTRSIGFASLATDGDTLVVGVRSTNAGGGSAIVAIDVATGESSTVSIHADFDSSRQNPGPLLQTTYSDKDAPPFVEVYSVANRQSIRVNGLTSSYYRGPSSQAWARVGDRMVTALGRDDTSRFIATVAPDGSVTRQPTPCGEGARWSGGGGIMPIPGATLVLCPNGTSGGPILDWELVGLR